MKSSSLKVLLLDFVPCKFKMLVNTAQSALQMGMCLQKKEYKCAIV